MTFVSGKTKEEKNKIYNEVVNLLEKEHFTLGQVSEKFNTSRQALTQFLIRRNYNLQELIRENKENVKEARKRLISKIQDEQILNSLDFYRSKINELEHALIYRKRRCEELTEAISKNTEVVKLNIKLEELKKNIANLRTYNCYLKRQIKSLKKEI